jgi:hypothetical protein
LVQPYGAARQIAVFAIACRTSPASAPKRPSVCCRRALSYIIVTILASLLWQWIRRFCWSYRATGPAFGRELRATPRGGASAHSSTPSPANDPQTRDTLQPKWIRLQGQNPISPLIPIRDLGGTLSLPNAPPTTPWRRFRTFAELRSNREVRPWAGRTVMTQSNGWSGAETTTQLLKAARWIRLPGRIQRRQRQATRGGPPEPRRDGISWRRCRRRSWPSPLQCSRSEPPQ